MYIIVEHFEYMKLWVEEVIIDITLLQGDVQFFSQLHYIRFFLRIYPQVCIRYIYLSKLMGYIRFFLNIFLLVRNQCIYPCKPMERTQFNIIFSNSQLFFFLLEHIQLLGQRHILLQLFHKAFFRFWFLLLLIGLGHFLLLQLQQVLKKFMVSRIGKLFQVDITQLGIIQLIQQYFLKFVQVVLTQFIQVVLTQFTQVVLAQFVQVVLTQLDIIRLLILKNMIVTRVGKFIQLVVTLSGIIQNFLGCREVKVVLQVFIHNINFQQHFVKIQIIVGIQLFKLILILDTNMVVKIPSMRVVKVKLIFYRWFSPLYKSKYI